MAAANAQTLSAQEQALENGKQTLRDEAIGQIIGILGTSGAARASVENNNRTAPFRPRKVALNMKEEETHGN